MTYEEALAFWYGRIDYERRSAKPGDLKLDRMRALLRQLGDPHQRVRVVHVAGTKGKGSTSAMLASVLRAAGYRVGLFTSPHLSSVTERIQVNGVPISAAELAARVEEVAPVVRAMERGGPERSPTFFEVATALGFLHFDCRRVDFGVVEVGLGGRFDSTNVCAPMLCVITNISFDHMAQLGSTLQQIAREKAGIIKRGRPVVTTADAPQAAFEIEQIAAARRAVLTELGRDFVFRYVPGDLRHDVAGKVQVSTRSREWPALELGLAGAHQAQNAAGVVAAVEQLRQLGVPIGDAAVARGLKNPDWPARLEVVSKSPLVLLDCAHNVASVEALVATLQESFPAAGRKTLLFAVSNDKQVQEMLRVLAPHFDRFCLTRYANNPRCVPPEQLAAPLREVAPSAMIEVFQSAADAWESARNDAQTDDLIAISGSVFLAGELRALSQSKPH